METRLVPMVAWFWAYAGSGYQMAPPSPLVVRDRWLQAIAFAGWTFGVPLLALGMFDESAGLVRLGAWSLFVGLAIGTIDNLCVVVPALRARS
jgi:hypothetical protein